MAKEMSFLVCLSLSVLVLQTNALSFVNNVTVPSDILTTMFFDEIQNNAKLDFNISIPNTGTYNSVKCVLALRQIVSRFPSLDVLPFIDSWGKFPSGILFGHPRDLGNFDQCVRISKQLSATTGVLRGQYCFATIPLIKSQSVELPNVIGVDTKVADKALADLLGIQIAICAPDICDPSLLQVIFQKAAANILGGALSGIKIGSQCVTAKRPDMEPINVVGIVIFSIVAALMVLSTVYDAFTESFGKSPIPLLLAFSVLTNGRKLFAITTKKSPNSIDCLIGIRVLSMAWVLYCHNYQYFLTQPMINFIDLIPERRWIKSASSMHIIEASVSVDSFLFVSGLLVAWLGMRELDKSKGKLNVPLMYVHRYIRLTPAVAAVILFYVSIDKLIGTGPYRESLVKLNTACQTTWWSTLLYVQNYVNPSNICIGQSWYLAVDTQLYFISPFILILLWKWGKKFIPVLVVLALLSIGCIIATFFAEGYHSLWHENKRNYSRLIYFPTHTRYSVWIIGIIVGYFMYTNRNKSMRPSKLLQLLGWIVSFGTILAIIYAPYFTIHADRATTVLEAALYESLKRSSWAIALAWIVFACYFGFGGIVNTILSHPWWQPLGRLTYSMYLVHLIVLSINFGITRTDKYFSDYHQMLGFWSMFGTSVMASIVLTLAFESPVLLIEKSLLGGGGSKTKIIRQENPSINVTECEPVESAQSVDKTV